MWDDDKGFWKINVTEYEPVIKYNVIIAIKYVVWFLGKKNKNIFQLNPLVTDYKSHRQFCEINYLKLFV